MKVETRRVDELNANLKLIIEKDDYLDDFKGKLKEYQKKAHIKGFRKGRTPMSAIRKMYGNSLLQESVSKILSDKLNKIITGEEEDLNIIGEPYLVNREELPVLDHHKLDDYSYEFELGLEPDFAILGLGENDVYPKYKVDITEKMIDEEVESLLKRLGEQKSVDAQIEEGDVVYFKAEELEGDNLKEDGYQSDFTTSTDKITKAYKDKLLSSKTGDSLDVQIYSFEEGMEPTMVEKYLLKLPEDADMSEMNDDFRLTITDVKRVVKAELNQETFDKCFGEGEVSSEDELRERIKSYLGDYFSAESDKLVNREIMQVMMDVNEVLLPEDFLKKWIGEGKEPMTDEQFESFKKELKWRLIKKKLVAKYAVEVKEEEIFGHFVQMIKNYSPYVDEETLKKTAMSLMQNREQVNSAVETISSGKMFDELRKEVKTEDKGLTMEEFQEKVKEINQRAQ